MSITAIIGFPFSGRRTLAGGLAQRRGLEIVDTNAFRRVMESSTDPSAAHARQLAAEGKILPANLRGELWWLATQTQRGSLLVGFPGSVQELHAYEAVSSGPVTIIHISTTLTVIQERYRAATGSDLEVTHPGATERMSNALSEICNSASPTRRLVTLAGNQPIEDLMEAALAHVAMPQ